MKWKRALTKKVIWTERARDSLDYYCGEIALNSESAAKKVRQEIIHTCTKLAQFPELFQLDEYYPENPGNIRRFFKWSYRVVYLVTDDQVVILNVYHTSTDPEKNK